MIAILAVLAMSTATTSVAGPTVQGLDHVPVAVADLDQAAADFGRLGFVLKPGRPHTNGLGNRHVKFPNGGGIELITASNPGDDLAREYAEWLKGGDGPAFWSLFSPDLQGLTAILKGQGLKAENEGGVVTVQQGPAASRLFFGSRQRSPTDGPIYWNHPNTAYRLAGVWLSGNAPDLTLLSTLGVRPAGLSRCSPFDRKAAVFRLSMEGEQVLVARGVSRAPERSIIGLTVAVRDLQAARAVLTANHVEVVTAPACGSHSLWIPPAAAHDMWLELSDRTDGPASAVPYLIRQRSRK
ncbi:MAG: hypothetical protein CFE28_04895 [Alphaproteobacteria bacterium PA2]|nr:MAG: hypothetical protein CFE28_04895 [Alphaproteobacteria bacterium PA2]